MITHIRMSPLLHTHFLTPGFENFQIKPVVHSRILVSARWGKTTDESCTIKWVLILSLIQSHPEHTKENILFCIMYERDNVLFLFPFQQLKAYLCVFFRVFHSVFTNGEILVPPARIRIPKYTLRSWENVLAMVTEKVRLHTGAVYR